MISTMGFAASVVAPIFILIFIGIFMRRIGIIGKEFITAGSKIVFNAALPALIFLKLSAVEAVPEGLAGVILLFAAVTLIIFTVLWFISRKLPAPVYGSFVQGAFRGNITIIGLAVIEQSFGPETIQAALVIIMVMMPVYNLLAVTILSRSSVGVHRNILKQIFLNLVKNPLIWSIAAGLIFGLNGFHLPVLLDRTLGYLSQLAMPLALIGIGGSLTLTGLMKNRSLWISASAVKLFVLPLAVWAASMLLGLPEHASAAAVISAACPSAVSGFAMAEAMGADGGIAGEIISATTLFSILSITFWIVVLL